MVSATSTTRSSSFFISSSFVSLGGRGGLSGGAIPGGHGISVMACGERGHSQHPEMDQNDSSISFRARSSLQTAQSSEKESKCSLQIRLGSRPTASTLARNSSSSVIFHPQRREAITQLSTAQGTGSASPLIVAPLRSLFVGQGCSSP
jgi:hypothetical protein